MSKNDAAVYRKAAARIANKPYDQHRHWCCCDSLFESSGHDLIGAFSIFRNPKSGQYDFWFGSVKVGINKEQRILALCFAAAMAETGDL